MKKSLSTQQSHRRADFVLPRQILARQGGLIVCVAVMSGFVNILTLAGPIYMLNAYDHALGGQSVETLVALSVVMVGAFAFMGMFDFLRTRLMARVAARFRSDTERHIGNRIAVAHGDKDWPQEHLDSTHAGLESQGLIALFDLPWLPINLGVLFLFHPVLGFFALAVGIFAVLLAFLGHVISQLPQALFSKTQQSSKQWGDLVRQNRRLASTTTMNMFDELQHHRNMKIRNQILLGDRRALITSATKSTRMMAQSGILGLAIYLSIVHELSAGMILAASILLARFLSPIDAVIGQWATLRASYRGWERLGLWFANTHKAQGLFHMAPQSSRLEVQDVTIVPPGGREPSLMRVNFTLEPGQVIGVVGPSGSGKTSLINACAGLWPLSAGRILCGDVLQERVDPAYRAQYFGVCSDDPLIMPVTIAENISNLDEAPNFDDILDVSKMVGLHDIISALPEGYDTVLSEPNALLSRSQRQALGLARVVYAQPKLLLLDAPDAFLDHTGDALLQQILTLTRAQNHCAILTTQRPSTLAKCDLVMVLEHGSVAKIGPTTEILSAIWAGPSEAA